MKILFSMKMTIHGIITSISVHKLAVHHRSLAAKNIGVQSSIVSKMYGCMQISYSLKKG